MTPEFPRIAYRDAMLWYGTDKPDLRNPIRMQVVTEHFRGSGFRVFAGLLEQAGTEVRAIPAPGGGSRAFCDRMNAYAQGEGLPGMGYIFWREGDGGGGAGRQGARAGADRGDPRRSSGSARATRRSSSAGGRRSSRRWRARRATSSGGSWG